MTVCVGIDVGTTGVKGLAVGEAGGEVLPMKIDRSGVQVTVS